MNIGITRVSSIGQKDNTSLSNQKRMITEYCSVYDIQLDDIIEEVYTGTTSNRDGLNHLKTLVNDGVVKSVVVMKLDRLMRSFSEGVVFIKYLLDNDVKIISVQEKIDTSSISGRFLMNILLSVSEMERNTIVNRMNMVKKVTSIRTRKSLVEYVMDTRNKIIRLFLILMSQRLFNTFIKDILNSEKEVTLKLR